MANKKKKVFKNSSLPIILLFISVSLAIIFILEYLDFKNGKNSFIFTKIIKLAKEAPRIIEKKPVKVEPDFSSRLLNIFFDREIKIEYFKDKTNIFHIKASLENSLLKDRLIKKIGELSKKCNQTLNLSEVKKQNNLTLNLYQIFLKQKLTHILLITVKSPPIRMPTGKNKWTGKIAFIMDDIGYASDSSLKLKNLNIPITASIIPSSSYARDESFRLKKFGIETMIHIPMQSLNNNYTDKNWDFISETSTYAEIRKIVEKAQKIIPFASGINNHMGSLITSEPELISLFMKSIVNKNLFFVDSRTSQDSVAYRIAKNFGIRTVFRDVFLDHVQDYRSTIQQIKRLVSIARHKGQAVGIGHPYETTFRALRDSIPYLNHSKIKIVNVSTLME
jgi:polysaccharide deacetylase 2 family uncharacterized protein YibQ